MENQKRTRKNPIKFKISLNSEQKVAKQIILDNDIVILTGKAGSGKSVLAAQVSLDLLFTGQVDKIIIARPTVAAGEDLGYMPGGIDEKLAPYTSAIFSSIVDLTGHEKLDSLLEEGKIEVLPLGFMRGRNFSSAIVVLEEAQNTTHGQMELFLTRLCTGSKMIMTGDVDQIDLKPKTLSGLPFIIKFLSSVETIKIVELKVNHRHPIVEDILKIYKENVISYGSIL